MPEEDFEQLCMQHDLTYSYSDDHRKWRNGNESLHKIREAAKFVDNAAEIWNRVVDRKLKEDVREKFYWK